MIKSDTLSVIEERMPPRTAERRHYHEHSRQLFYILSGCATFELDGLIQILLAGQFIRVPPKAHHRIVNSQDEDLTFLVISSPVVNDDRVEIETGSESR
jgi:mannose-6-phosphate isomerase-like protein (cupin superfamily)